LSEQLLNSSPSSHGHFLTRTFFSLLVHNLLTSAGLPDAASIEAASWVEPGNDRTVLIDASTAFRVDKDWVYGFPGA
jgi:hypothetical protein